MSIRQIANKLINEIELRSGATKLHSAPVSVDVVLTKACNLACKFCKDYAIEGAKNVSKEQLERVASQLFPLARRLSICSGGEPYLHRELEHILRLAKKHDLYTWVLSNGMLLQEDRMRRILEEDLIDEHGFSVDGIQPATVEGIRIFAKLDVLLRNVDMVFRLRKELNRNRPKVVIRYALMRANIEELPAAIEYWGGRGASRIDTGYLSLANGIPHEESLYYHQDLMKKVFDQARKTAERYPELKVTYPNFVEDDLNRKEATPCHAPWRFVMIDASGAILPCYRAFEALEMGNLYTDQVTDFREIWNSESYQALRRTVNTEGEKHYPYCQQCEARFGWGQEASHLGDETWFQVVSGQMTGEKLHQIDHRRLKK